MHFEYQILERIQPPHTTPPWCEMAKSLPSSDIQNAIYVPLGFMLVSIRDTQLQDTSCFYFIHGEI